MSGDGIAANIRKRPHHNRDELCKSRPSYRQGKKLTAVKVENDFEFEILFQIFQFFAGL